MTEFHAKLHPIRRPGLFRTWCDAAITAGLLLVFCALAVALGYAVHLLVGGPR